MTKYVGRAVLALDWERADNPQFGNGAWVDRWVRRVYERTRVWPVIYIPASALWQLSGYVRRHCGVWVAQYASNAVTGWQSRPWRYGVYGEAMRQYTGNGRVAGYAGAIDLDYFRAPGGSGKLTRSANANARTSNRTSITYPCALIPLGPVSACGLFLGLGGRVSLRLIRLVART